MKASRHFRTNLTASDDILTLNGRLFGKRVSNNEDAFIQLLNDWYRMTGLDLDSTGQNHFPECHSNIQGA